VISLETENDSVGLAKNQRYKHTRLWAWARQSKIGESARACRRCRRELWAWANCKGIAAISVERLAKSIEVLGAHASNTAEETETPIFLLSTGWRAGSTLLQRILVTDPRLLLWGEPLAEMTIVSRIAEMLSNSISSRNLQLWRDQQDANSLTLSTSWVANLYPPSGDFRSGLQSLFNQWLGEPAYQRGFGRWGLKEVRIGAAEAVLLRWLYPNARFLVISRHPYDSYRSLADSGWDQVFYRYPDVSVDSAASFAKHWNRLALSWRELPAGFPFVHIKYEDLIGGKVDFRALESWLGLEIKENVALSAEVGGTARRTKLSWCERTIIRHEAAEGMQAIGYSE